MASSLFLYPENADTYEYESDAPFRVEVLSPSGGTNHYMAVTVTFSQSTEEVRFWGNTFTLIENPDDDGSLDIVFSDGTSISYEEVASVKKEPFTTDYLAVLVSSPDWTKPITLIGLRFTVHCHTD